MLHDISSYQLVHCIAGDDVKLILKLWNKAFAMMNKKDPDNSHCDKTQEAIDMAIEHMHVLKLSITPQCHGIANHVVGQMRAVHGYSMMLEYWVEHYHQVAHQYDVYWRTLSNIQKEAELRARIETMMKNKQAKKESKLIGVKFVGV